MFEGLTKVLDSLGMAINWSIDNALPYVVDFASRVILADTIKNALICLGCILIFIVVLVVASKITKAVKEELGRRYDFSDAFVVWVPAFIIGTFPAVGFCFSGARIIQNIIIPELTLIELLTNFIK